MKQVWGPSAMFGSVSIVAAALTLLLPETGHSGLSEPTDFSATKVKEEKRNEYVSQNNSANKDEAAMAHENLSYVEDK